MMNSTLNPGRGPALRAHAVRRRSERGVTLIEVLIAMVVLLVGLLGLAGLQVASMRGTTDQAQRGIAVRASSDLAERIRANYLAIDTAGSGYIAQAAGATTATATCYGAANSCSASARVATDLVEWRNAIANLPGAAGSTVCRDLNAATSTGACTGGTSDPLVVKVLWQSRDHKGAVAATQPPPVWVLVQP